ncbi:MAG: hypothetical protein KGL39_34240 [Patescibacteria group bacterium]|nr:hypothetical protein [Patescibacteria group bacterium]
MFTVEHGYSTRKQYAWLMRGRPDEPASHQSLAVYSKAEHDEFRRRGWKPAREFMDMVDRARRKE